MKMNLILNKKVGEIYILNMLFFLSLIPSIVSAQCPAPCDDLSNLATETNIDAHLVPASDNALDLGGEQDEMLIEWRNIYLGNALFLTVPPLSGGGSGAPQKFFYINNVPFIHNTGGGTGTDNEGVYVGGYAGLNIKHTASVNNGCVAFGYNALQNLGSGYPGGGGGSDKTGIGNHNTAIGWRSLYSLNGSSTDGADKNTMVGSKSGESIDYGKENTGIGWNVFFSGTNGSGTIHGSYNVGVGGNNILGLLSTGSYNTVIGHSSGQKISTGNNNIIIGYNSGSGTTPGIQSGNNNILIGNEVNTTASSSSYQLNIGNLLYGNLTTPLSIGIGSNTLTSMFNVGTAADFQVSDIGKIPRYGGATPASGQLLIGDGTDMELATLSEGSAIDITNGEASIIISLDINELPIETVTDVDVDFIPFYDDSEAANNKMTPETILATYVSDYRKHRFDYYNEFINGVSNATGGNDIVSVNNDGGGSIAAAATSATNVVGIVRSSTGNTEATGRTSCSSGAAAVAFGGGIWIYELYITGLVALSTATEEYQIIVGFFDVNSSVDQTDGVYFLYNRLSSTEWLPTAANNTSKTYGDSNTEVSTSAVTLKIVIDAVADNAYFYIDGSLVSTISSGIPKNTNRATGFGWLLIKDEGTANRTMDVDYISVQCDYTTSK